MSEAHTFARKISEERDLAVEAKRVVIWCGVASFIKRWVEKDFHNLTRLTPAAPRSQRRKRKGRMRADWLGTCFDGADASAVNEIERGESLARIRLQRSPKLCPHEAGSW